MSQEEQDGIIVLNCCGLWAQAVPELQEAGAHFILDKACFCASPAEQCAQMAAKTPIPLWYHAAGGLLLDLQMQNAE